MASKWSIENSANIKMLINMIQTAGGIDEDNNIFLPVEKTEHGLLKISKEKLQEYASSGMSISDLYNKLLKQSTTSIFYMNTNNGYTKFEDGTKIESVANRLVSFPSNMKHKGTSCTDEKTRVVINFNHFR